MTTSISIRLAWDFYGALGGGRRIYVHSGNIALNRQVNLRSLEVLKSGSRISPAQQWRRRSEIYQSLIEILQCSEVQWTSKWMEDNRQHDETYRAQQIKGRNWKRDMPRWRTEQFMTVDTHGYAFIWASPSQQWSRHPKLHLAKLLTRKMRQILTKQLPFNAIGVPVGELSGESKKAQLVDLTPWSLTSAIHNF